MITLQHSLVTLFGLRGNEEEFDKEVPYVLIPDAIRRYCGPRPYSHFEENPDGTDISDEGYLDVANGTTVAGVASSGETLAEAIQRTISKVAYTGVMCAKYMDNDEIEAAEAVVSANDLIFVNVWYSVNDITGVCKTIKDASLNKVRCLVYTNGFESAKLMLAAYVGRAFSVNFEGIIIFA